jgi:hypothetical protein
MGAFRLERPHAAVLVAKQDDVLPAQRDQLGLVVMELLGTKRRIPVLAKSQERDALLILTFRTRRSPPGAFPCQSKSFRASVVRGMAALLNPVRSSLFCYAERVLLYDTRSRFDGKR